MTTQQNAIADQIRSAFNFSVDKYRLAGPENMRTDHFGLFRSDTLECIGSACRQSYNPHTVDDIVALVEAADSVFDGDCQIKCRWRNGHVVTVAPSKEYRRSIFGTDTLWPRMLITAGYDGRAFCGSLGWFRDACKNLAMFSLAGSSASARIRHTESMRGNIDALRQQFLKVANAWERTVANIMCLEEKTVRLSDFVREVYPSQTKTRASDRRIEAIFRRVAKERQSLGKPEINSRFEVSAWDAFNGIQGYIQHDQRRRGNPDQLERALMALDSETVRKAEQIAFAA